MAQVDLAIRNGEIVTGSTMYVADIGIRDEKIVQIGGDLEAEQSIDAAGMLVLPGCVDAHVHLTGPKPRHGRPMREHVDDFTSGSAAALAGGVTTLGNMTWILDHEDPLQALQREAELAEAESIADVILHPVLEDISDETLAQIPHLLEAGHNSIKYFMMFPTFEPQVARYVQATRTAGQANMITLIHCEDYGIIQDTTRSLLAEGKSGARYYPDARPEISEVVATQRAVAIAEATGAPVYVVHVASARALAVCAEAQARGIPVYVEVRPIYLHLTRERFEEPDGAKYVGNPPLRTQQDLDALWAGIQQGTVHTVCTDHAPWLLKDKLDPTLTIANFLAGVENLQTMMPMLYSEGVRTGRISVNRFVEVLATNAAKLFGIYPTKGTIAVGSDADLVIFDPTLERRIEAAMLKSKSDYTPYEGWDVTGWPVMTIRRGEVVFRGDVVTGAAGTGKMIHRQAMVQL